jgi:hypothetical protein
MGTSTAVSHSRPISSLRSARMPGTAGMLFAPAFLVQWVEQTIRHRPASPTTPLDSTLGLLYLIGWACSAIGLRRLRAYGSGTLANALFAIQLAGLVLAATEQVLELTHRMPPENSWQFAVVDLPWPISHLYMLVIGIGVIVAKRWTGWRRFAPLACGLALPLSMALTPFAGKGAMLLGFSAFTAAAFLSLGYAVRSSE